MRKTQLDELSQSDFYYLSDCSKVEEEEDGDDDEGDLIFCEEEHQWNICLLSYFHFCFAISPRNW